MRQNMATCPTENEFAQACVAIASHDKKNSVEVFCTTYQCLTDASPGGDVLDGLAIHAVPGKGHTDVSCRKVLRTLAL